MIAVWIVIALMVAIGVHMIRKAKREADQAEARIRASWRDGQQ